jgi:hypothetical protein
MSWDYMQARKEEAERRRLETGYQMPHDPIPMSPTMSAMFAPPTIASPGPSIEAMADKLGAQRRSQDDPTNIQPQNLAPAIGDRDQPTPTPTPQGDDIADYAARAQAKATPTSTAPPSRLVSPSSVPMLSPEHHVVMHELLSQSSTPSASASLGPSIDSLADQRESAYKANPEQFERDRMAAPPVSGELRYSVDGGPMRSYNTGANRTDIAGDPAFAATRRDKVFGQDRTSVAQGGGVSYPGGTGGTMVDDKVSDEERYRRNVEGNSAVDADLAQRALNRKLAANPFAKEDADKDRQIAVVRAQADAAEAARSGKNRYDAQRDLILSEAQKTANQINAAVKSGAMTQAEAAQRHDILQRKAGQYLYSLEQARADEAMRKNAGSVFADAQ